MDTLIVIAVVVPWVIAAALLWFVYLLIKQNARTVFQEQMLSSRLIALEGAVASGRQADAQAPAPVPLDDEGLELGTPAPDFALPDLDGRVRTLSEFLGEPRVVIFFNTGCGYCMQMAPDLGRLPAGTHRPLLISRGDREEHRRLAEEHGWDVDLLFEDGWEVAGAFKASGTPTGYLLDARGRIASRLAVGSINVLGLAEAEPIDVSANGAAKAEAKDGVAKRYVAASRIKRDGLEAGTPAPDFTLPDLEGNERSLSEFRGRRVLLVFSDPTCAPCQAMAPDLERLHAGQADDGLEVLMVSRGDVDANREKAQEHGLTLPILIQSGWQVSKQYALFGTPVGYLIDEQGVVAKSAGVGAAEIMKLVGAQGAAKRSSKRKRGRSRRTARAR